MLIAVPSKGRARKTKTDKVLPNSVFFVPKNEVHQYDYIKNVVGVPNDVKGITETRNWILNNTQEIDVVFLDDDVKTCGYSDMNERKCKKIEIRDEEFWMKEFKKAFEVTNQLGYKIWGVRTESSPRGTYPMKPVLFKGYVTASCMGIINDGEFMFDEKFKVKEDYEICLRYIVKYNGILAIRYLHWENDHWEQDGGCKAYRTVAMEKKAIKDLIKLYPGMIRSAKRKANKFTIGLNL